MHCFDPLFLKFWSWTYDEIVHYVRQLERRIHSMARKQEITKQRHHGSAVSFKGVYPMT